MALVAEIARVSTCISTREISSQWKGGGGGGGGGNGGGEGGELQCILFNLWQECKTIDLATLISMVKQNPPLCNTMMRQFIELLMQKVSLLPPRSR